MLALIPIENTVFALIPIIALAIPALAVLFNGLQKVQRLRIEEARIRGGELGTGAEAELRALHAEVDDLRRELGEVQERLDFTERMLARQPDRDRLPGGPAPGG